MDEDSEPSQYIRKMKVHFISIGGAVMHNLALAMLKAGHIVTGSDDEIKDPARTRLEKAGLLPETEGWFPNKITPDLNMVILGMHARHDNPELKKALELQLTVYSFPEFLYEMGKDKNRVVIGGSHGKTTSTGMLLHIFHQARMEVDYMVGSQLPGFDTMVHYAPQNEWMILEGDEYLTSPIDLRPKFHVYQATHAMLTGIAWDHINVFPTLTSYHQAFETFIQQLPDGAPLAWFKHDQVLQSLVEKNPHIQSIPYETHPYRIVQGQTELQTDQSWVPVPFFGEHFLQNASGILHLGLTLGLTHDQIYQGLSTFPGTARRMEMWLNTPESAIVRDFAHSPSKVKATVQALRQQFPDRILTAVFELHTFSSLNDQFLDEYQGALQSADQAYVYMNPHTLAMKKMPPISPQRIQEAFGGKVTVLEDSADIISLVSKYPSSNANLLLMSSGTFDGLNRPSFS